MSQSNFDLFSRASPAPTRSPAPASEPMTVTQLNQRARQLLERQLGQVVVVGEVSNFKISGGHCYFALKDSSSTLPATLFRREASRVRFKIKNGMEVVVTGKLSLYVPYGRYQIICETMEPRGVGALQLAFNQLKETLHREGLFDEGRKRRLPLVPKRVGVITSPTGAVIRDIIHVATRRFPNANILLIPSRVQGAEAAPTIVKALQRVSASAREWGLDAVIVGRGGGSMEDLWGYNDEAVARAIVACSIPVVSAVGHETDFTIADFVADRRAPTPSAAAEILFPVRSELIGQLHRTLDRGAVALRRDGSARRRRIEMARRLLGDGRGVLREYSQRLTFAQERLRSGWSGVTLKRRLRLQAQEARLGRLHPRVGLRNTRLRLEGLGERLELLTRQRVKAERQAVRAVAGRLHALSPLGVLERGYSIVLGPEGRAVTEAASLKPGDALDIRVAKGAVKARVDEVNA